MLGAWAFEGKYDYECTPKPPTRCAAGRPWLCDDAGLSSNGCSSRRQVADSGQLANAGVHSTGSGENPDDVNRI